jgi:ABC-type multidrug transport system fused ATPase/permease subunit
VSPLNARAARDSAAKSSHSGGAALKFKTIRQEAFELIWIHRRRLAVGACLMLVNRASTLALPWMSKYIVDDVIPKKELSLLYWYAGAAIVALLVQTCTDFLLTQVVGIAAHRAIADMRKSIEQHIARLPVSFFDSTQSGALISRVMTDPDGVRNLVGTGIVQLVGGTIGALGALGFLLYLNWQLTLVTLGILAVFGAAMAFSFKRLRPIFRERSKISAEVSGRLGESLSGIRIVKAYTAEKREDLVFARGAHRLFRNVYKTMTGTATAGAVATLTLGLVATTMAVLGSRAIVAGTMTGGDFLSYLFFTAFMVGPVVQIASIGTQITDAFAGLERIRELKQVAEENADDPTKTALPTLRGDIALENVSFEYSPGAPVLKNISFSAPAGSTTALVGSSGSGKSTLIGLIMGFHKPLSGRLTVDGSDLNSLRMSDYRKHLAVVLQDNMLFDGTVLENVRFARPRASMEEVRRACRVAHCLEFIEKFEKGFDTRIGERGVKVSGGQRQRLAIARAILVDPRILILDEATSSLDSESEAMIQEGLRTLRSGRTSFVIAHRLSTIRGANQILVLEGGEIVERGTHAELFALKGRYRQLYDKQYALETDRFINPGEELKPADALDVAEASPQHAAGG